MNFIIKEPALASEAWFLALIHYNSSKFFESLKNLKLAITIGGRSIGWNFDSHINLIKEKTISSHNYEHVEWLYKLSNIISNGN